MNRQHPFLSPTYHRHHEDPTAANRRSSALAATRCGGLRFAAELYQSQLRFWLEGLIEEEVKERIDPDVDRRLNALELAAAETAIALEDMGVIA